MKFIVNSNLKRGMLLRATEMTFLSTVSVFDDYDNRNRAVLINKGEIVLFIETDKNNIVDLVEYKFFYNNTIIYEICYTKCLFGWEIINYE